MYYDEKKLIGSKVEKAEINASKDLIILYTDKGKFNLTAYGDCCSTSWFEHISGADELIGQTINNFETVDVDIDLPETDNEYEVIQVYGYKLKTNKGELFIELRNSSNGYYGGAIEVYSDLSKSYGDYDTDNLKTLEDF